MILPRYCHRRANQDSWPSSLAPISVANVGIQFWIAARASAEDVILGSTTTNICLSGGRLEAPKKPAATDERRDKDGTAAAAAAPGAVPILPATLFHSTTAAVYAWLSIRCMWCKYSQAVRKKSHPVARACAELTRTAESWNQGA